MTWSREACDLWVERFGGTCPGGRIGKALKPLVERHGWDSVRLAWRYYLSQVEARYVSPVRFSDTYGDWSNRCPRDRGSVDTEAVARREAAYRATPRGPGEALEDWIARIDRKVEELKGDVE
jgi:hypothetical protein